MTDFINVELCAQCGGKCCKAMPGSVHPEDMTREQVADMLATGRYTVDWREGDPRSGTPEAMQLSTAPYLRPAIKGYEGRLRHAGWGGPCTFLTEHGCELAPEERPRNCRLLEPRAEFGKIGEDCVLHGASKRETAIAWIPFWDWLEDE